ncbi:MAG: acetate/propionate family kinase [Rubrivivax sp.]|nr:acetate/propionate family kinase [Rubrivivax sp.]
MIVLALNSGSSSLKFGLFRVHAESAQPLVAGQLGGIGELTAALAGGELPVPQAIGHRVVHGGPGLRTHTVIDDPVMRQIESAAEFAPLHVPAALAIIQHSRRLFSGLPQVACFDTAFHATLPDVARVLPVPKALLAQGIQRYGFHGLSCESVLCQLARDLPQGLPDRVLIAHLGHGASVTAVRAGRSVDTSMGLTPSGGLVMGTRSGDIDPGLLIHLLRRGDGDIAQLEELLDRRSGLLGISGLSSDMRQLHAAEATDADARLAVCMFCVSVAKQLAAMATALGGADLIVFTGGIGENDVPVRAAICERLGWMGVALEPAGPAAGQAVISAAHSSCEVRVVATQEEAQIARHTARLLSTV